MCHKPVAGEQVIQQVYNTCLLGSELLPVIVTVHIQLRCFPTTFPHISSAIQALILWWNALSIPVEGSHSLVLYAIVSQRC
jgi:hypothetical protein